VKAPEQTMQERTPRIAYVVHSLNPGGAERLAADMALALAGEYEMSLVCLDEPGLWAQTLRDKGVPVHCLYRQPGLDLRIPWLLARLAGRERIDVWHAHQYTPWFYAALSRLFRPGPGLLFEEHGRHYPEVKKNKRVLVNRCLLQPLTHDIVAVSRDIKQRLAAYEGLAPGRISVVPNGASKPPPASAREIAALRAELGLSQTDWVLGTVGRFDPIKNLPLLLDSLREVRESGYEAKALLVGDGPDMDRVRARIRELGLEQVVVLTGYRDDAQKLVQTLDLFVLPSLSEGTSMALLEAMAQGIPCLVTDVGGNPEVVESDGTGWVVPSEDRANMAATICEAARDPEKSTRFAQAGQARYERLFSFQAMLQGYRALYERTARRERSGELKD